MGFIPIYGTIYKRKKELVYLKIGYACLTVGVLNTQLRTCRKANATKDRLRQLIQNNLNALETMIDYNHREGIRLYRISSDLIPFGSDLSTNTIDWEQEFQEDFKRIGEKIKKYNQRVSMHPGQYTVINSPKQYVVERSFLDLEYHTKVLEALGTNQEHKIVLHIGGVYEDKKKAIARFISAYQQLSPSIKKRLIIENDDRLYTIQDVLYISEQTGAPVVYDNLHHQANHQIDEKSDAYWIEQAQKTWKKEDGIPKVHYFQQRKGARIGAHTKTIYIKRFMEYFESIQHLDVDIMLEVKDKNLSAVKCIVSTAEKQNVQSLEREWARYKYLVLEYAPQKYQAIRRLLKDKSQSSSVEFYQMIEAALNQLPTLEQRVNAADHIWGHIKNKATEREKTVYQNVREKFLYEEASIKRLKNQLFRYAKKYEDKYLKQSLYFAFN